MKHLLSQGDKTVFHCRFSSDDSEPPFVFSPHDPYLAHAILTEMKHPTSLSRGTPQDSIILETNRRIQELEKELAIAYKRLEISRCTNHDLFSNLNEVHSRLYHVIDTLNPPTSSCEPERKLYAIRKELMRLHAAETAITLEAIVETAIFEKIGMRGQPSRWKNSEPISILSQLKDDLKFEFGSVQLQKLWHGCWTRESLYRQKIFRAAKSIQKCYRRYRFQSIAWQLCSLAKKYM